MAFIDVDEFLVIRNTTIATLPQLLREYTSYAALAVNWRVIVAPSVMTCLLLWQDYWHDTKAAVYPSSSI